MSPKNIRDKGKMNIMDRKMSLLDQVLDVYRSIADMSSEKTPAFVFLKAISEFVC